MKTIKKSTAVFLILLSGFLWGTIGTFTTYLREAGLETMQIVFLRTSVTAVLLGALMAVRSRKQFRFRLRDGWIFIGTGLISFTMCTCCNILSMRLCSLSIAASLLYTSPLFVMLFSALLFKEKLTGRKLISMAVTILGALLVSGIFTPGASVSSLGVLAGIASGLSYGLYSIFGRYGVQRYDSLTVTFYTFLLASVASALFCDFGGIITAFTLHPWAIAFALLFGPVTCLTPYLAYAEGLTGVETGEASILATLEPVVGTLISVFWFHEEMDIQKLSGIILILGSVLIVNLSLSKRKKT